MNFFVGLQAYGINYRSLGTIQFGSQAQQHAQSPLNSTPELLQAYR